MRNKKYSLEDLYSKARKQIKERNMEGAQITLESGIILLANMMTPEAKDEDILEGTKRALWYERFWGTLEKNGMME